MSKDKQREAFEAWLVREYPHRTDGYIEWHESAGEYSIDEVQLAFEAYKAGAGSNHIGAVARIKTVGGYPDDSRHELELLVKYRSLHHGQLLYTSPQAQWLPIESNKPPCNESAIEYLVFDTLNNKVGHDYWMVPDDGSEPFWNHYSEYVSHWMPLPPEPKK